MIVRAIWARIHEPRLVNASWLVQHTIAFVIGAWFMADPPGGAWTGWTVGFIAAIGAATAATACYVGAWWLERAGLVAVGLGYVLTLIAICMMPGLDIFFKVLAFLSVAQAIFALVARYGTIAWAYLDPAKPEHA